MHSQYKSVSQNDHQDEIEKGDGEDDEEDSEDDDSDDEILAVFGSDSEDEDSHEESGKDESDDMNVHQGEIRGMVGKNMLKTQLQTGMMGKPSITACAKDSGAMSFSLSQGDVGRGDSNTTLASLDPRGVLDIFLGGEVRRGSSYHDSV
ncbi:nucleolin-like [Stylophora pistillata]|uniref:nucleolin-like n=1 Tax=Stylophora pistillata TaxID=50429 RepID=UPI000C039B84|nr:nucleolin-like [Stylophora pistillata]